MIKPSKLLLFVLAASAITQVYSEISPRILASESDQNSNDKTLTVKLHEMEEMAKTKTPPERRKIMEDAIEQLRDSHIIDHALKVGDVMPDFSLPDVKREIIHSKSLLRKRALIVVFYRGGWCPYCNLQLHDLQAHLGEIKKLGANLVAISPQTPDSSLSTAKKTNLDFYVLSDVGNKVARKFGIVYKLPENLKSLYKAFGVDLEKSNGTQDWELPLGVTYVVKPDHRVFYAFLDVDYKKRAETRDVLGALRSIQVKR